MNQVYLYMYIHICIYIYVCIYINIYTTIMIQVHIHMHIYIYIYIYIYTIMIPFHTLNCVIINNGRIPVFKRLPSSRLMLKTVEKTFHSPKSPRTSEYWSTQSIIILYHVFLPQNVILSLSEHASSVYICTAPHRALLLPFSQ